MRAAQVRSLDGPDAVRVVDVPEPKGESGAPYLVKVHCVGISFPDLLLSKGEYQLRPELPFTLGVDFAGVVREAPNDGSLVVGQRVAGVLPYGACAELVAVGEENTFSLPNTMSLEQGAALPMNYLTAEFALGARAALQAGETVLVHGGAGGVGTATIQVANGLGARTIAVVSTAEKADFAKRAGADEAVLVDGFLGQVKAITEDRGVDVVVDVVGGELFTDSLRALAPLGRLLVVGFTAGGIPEVRVNRLLLNNIDVRGVGWGAYSMVRPGFMQEQWRRLVPMMASSVVDPPLGSKYRLEEIGAALSEMEARRTLGKTVISLRD